MPQFSRVDRNLLVRICANLREQAEVVKRSHEPWTGAEGAREKKRYERLLRDENELRNFRLRLEAAHPEAVTVYQVSPKPAGAPAE